MKLGHFDKVVKNKSKEEVLIDANYTLSACTNEDGQGCRPCGAGGGPRAYICEVAAAPNEYADTIGKFFLFSFWHLGSNTNFIANHVVENTIDYIDDQLPEGHIDEQHIETILSAIRSPDRVASDIHDKNDADFAEIYKDIDFTPFTDLIEINFLRGPNWREKLREQKKKLSVMIKKQIGFFQNGVCTWAKFAASLSHTMGSDAPIIAGCLLLTNKVFNNMPNLYRQIREYDEESGGVANQFIERNYTDATIEELHEVSSDYMNCD